MLGDVKCMKSCISTPVGFDPHDFPGKGHRLHYSIPTTEDEKDRLLGLRNDIFISRKESEAHNKSVKKI